MSDPRLPMTVSRAALELDNASRGERGSFEATHRLAEFLNDSLNQDISGGAAHAIWLDANTVDVVGHALMEFEGAETVRTVQDVFSQAIKLVSEMEKASNADAGSDVDRLRRFCVAFGNNLLSYRAGLKHESSGNPRRR